MTVEGSFSDTPQQNISVNVNGSAVSFDVPPQIINGRTMIPLRAVSETIGGTVSWDADNKKAIIDCYNVKDKCNLICRIKIGSYLIEWEEGGSWLNGGKCGTIETDSPAVIVDNRTLVPFRAISELFGYEVGWDADTQTVSIEK